VKKLGAILEDAGLIDEIQLVRALSHQRKWHCRLGKSLVEMGFLDEETIAKTVAEQLGYVYVEFDPKSTPSELFEILPKQLAEERLFFPVGYSRASVGKSVVVAFGNPSDDVLIDDIRNRAGMPVEPVVARDSVIEDAVRGWDRWQESNRAGSNPEEALKRAHAQEAPTFESAKDTDTVKEEPPVESAQPPQEPEKGEPSFGATPTSAPQHTGIPGTEADLLSVSDLPPIEKEDSADKDDAAPEIDHSEPWEHAMPEGSEDAADKPESVSIDAPPSTPEIDHSEPWEHAMPEGSEDTAGDKTAEEAFAASPPRPNIDGQVPGIDMLDDLPQPSAPPAGKSLPMSDDEPELLSPDTVREITDQLEPEKPAETPQEETAPAETPTAEFPADPAQMRESASPPSEATSSEQAPDSEVTTADLKKEIDTLKEEVARLTQQVETLTKKLS